MKKLIALALCIVWVSFAHAEERQDRGQIRQAVADFLKSKTQDLTGTVRIQVAEIDSRLSLVACTQLEAFLPTGAQLLGKTNIGVRCHAPKPWTVYITATVTATVDLLVSSHPLLQGQTVSEADFSIQTGELNQVGLITDPTQALGKVLKYNIGAGQRLKHEMLRPPYAVTQGQQVSLIVEKEGFTIKTEGQCLNNAADGQPAQVKVGSGQVISGVAKTGGIVLVKP